MKDLNATRMKVLEQKGDPDRQQKEQRQQAVENLGRACAQLVIEKYPELLGVAASQGKCGIDFPFTFLADEQTTLGVISGAETELKTFVEGLNEDEQPNFWVSYLRGTHLFSISICMRQKVPLYDMSQLESQEEHYHSKARNTALDPKKLTISTVEVKREKEMAS